MKIVKFREFPLTLILFKLYPSLKGGFMKRAVFFAAFVFFGVLAFGQTLKDYTLVTPFYKEIKGTVNNVEQAKTKYAVCAESIGIPRQEGSVFFYTLSNYAGGGIVVETTAEQSQEIMSIKESQDLPLILLTRTGNQKNYRFVVDRVIPLREVYGVTVYKIPRNLKGQAMFEIIQLYINTGKTDPDGRVARALG